MITVISIETDDYNCRSTPSFELWMSVNIGRPGACLQCRISIWGILVASVLLVAIALFWAAAAAKVSAQAKDEALALIPP